MEEREQAKEEDEKLDKAKKQEEFVNQASATADLSQLRDGCAPHCSTLRLVQSNFLSARSNRSRPGLEGM